MRDKTYLKGDEEAFFQKRKSEAEKSLEKLKEAGNLKETAVVFSQEGMALFAQMFSNTIAEMVDKTVEDKMKILLEGFMEGMISQVFPEERKPKETPEKAIHIDPQESFKKRLEEYRENPKRKGRRARIIWTQEEELEIIRQYQEHKKAGVSDNKAIESITLEGRTTPAIKNRWHKELKHKQNDLLLEQE